MKQQQPQYNTVTVCFFPLKKKFHANISTLLKTIYLIKHSGSYLYLQFSPVHE